MGAAVAADLWSQPDKPGRELAAAQIEIQGGRVLPTPEQQPRAGTIGLPFRGHRRGRSGASAEYERLPPNALGQPELRFGDDDGPAVQLRSGLTRRQRPPARDQERHESAAKGVSRPSQPQLPLAARALRNPFWGRQG